MLFLDLLLGFTTSANHLRSSCRCVYYESQSHKTQFIAVKHFGVLAKICHKLQNIFMMNLVHLGWNSAFIPHSNLEIGITSPVKTQAAVMTHASSSSKQIKQQGL